MKDIERRQIVFSKVCDGLSISGLRCGDFELPPYVVHEMLGKSDAGEFYPFRVTKVSPSVVGIMGQLVCVVTFGDWD